MDRGFNLTCLLHNNTTLINNTTLTGGSKKRTPLWILGARCTDAYYR